MQCSSYCSLLSNMDPWNWCAEHADEHGHWHVYMPKTTDLDYRRQSIISNAKAKPYTTPTAVAITILYIFCTHWLKLGYWTIQYSKWKVLQSPTYQRSPYLYELPFISPTILEQFFQCLQKRTLTCLLNWVTPKQGKTQVHAAGKISLSPKSIHCWTWAAALGSSPCSWLLPTEKR